MANGQCMAVERQAFLDRGGMSLVAGDGRRGRRPCPIDGPRWRPGRIPRCERPPDRAHVRVVRRHVARVGALARAPRHRPARTTARRPRRSWSWPRCCPLPRLLTAPRRPARRDVSRSPESARSSAPAAPMTASTRRTGSARLADGLAAVALARGVVGRRRQTWRGRDYGRPTPIDVRPYRPSSASPAVSGRR